MTSSFVGANICFLKNSSVKNTELMYGLLHTNAWTFCLTILLSFILEKHTVLLL